jgi:hypothetical protein
LRPCNTREGWQGGSARSQMQKSSAEKFHSVSSQIILFTLSSSLHYPEQVLAGLQRRSLALDVGPHQQARSVRSAAEGGQTDAKDPTATSACGF